jgi:GTP pyrophosphokinase
MRVMPSGSDRAKRPTFAERVSNLISLGFVNDRAFVEPHLAETRTCIMPHAEHVSQDMLRGLGHLLEHREKAFGRWSTPASVRAANGSVT